MIKAKKNLNSLLEPLAPQKNESIINELIEENPLFKRSGGIEKNSALINRRAPPSPKSVVLNSINKFGSMSFNKKASGILKNDQKK